MSSEWVSQQNQPYTHMGSIGASPARGLANYQIKPRSVRRRLQPPHEGRAGKLRHAIPRRGWSYAVKVQQRSQPRVRLIRLTACFVVNRPTDGVAGVYLEYGNT